MLGAQDGTRYSDGRLYALALYMYSLNRPRIRTPCQRRRVAEKPCSGSKAALSCHTPPLYTNNMLTPAPGFAVPEDLRKTDAIMNVSVGSDPSLTTKSRRGTGFYKIPSLRGVW